MLDDSVPLRRLQNGGANEILLPILQFFVQVYPSLHWTVLWFLFFDQVTLALHKLIEFASFMPAL